MSITHPDEDKSYTRTNVLVTKFQLRMCRELRINMSHVLRKEIDALILEKKASSELIEANIKIEKLAQRYQKALDFMARRGLAEDFSNKSAE